MNSNWLYHKTKTGSIEKWRVFTKDHILYTEYGQIDGKLQISAGKECIATNVGRSNERTPIQQAEFEANALYQFKLTRKYSETIEKAQDILIQPMLAQDGHKISFKFPIDVQRKYDGVRCMIVWIDGEPKLLSRGNRYYDIRHIKEAILKILPEKEMLDGEIYLHGLSLQQITSLARKVQSDSLKLEYHVYDTPGNDIWIHRKSKLSQLDYNGIIKFVETFTVTSMDELIRLHDQFIMEGYEGAIIRLPDGLYEFGKRSRYLLKWKAFEDAEFEILSMEPGVGKMVDCPIFTVRNDINDKTFKVVPVGTMEVRKGYFNPGNIGKKITIKFLGRSDDGIPKIPVGKCIREF